MIRCASHYKSGLYYSLLVRKIQVYIDVLGMNRVLIPIWLIDLRRTNCKNPRVTSWGLASTSPLQNIDSLLAPELPMNILKNLRASYPHLFPTHESSKSSSNFPYFLSIDHPYHSHPTTTTTTEPSAALYSFVHPIELQTQPKRSKDQEADARYAARMRIIHSLVSLRNESDNGDIIDVILPPLLRRPWDPHQSQHSSRRKTTDILSAERGKYIKSFLTNDDQKKRRTFVLTRHPPPYTSTLSEIVQRSINEEMVRETHVERVKMFSGDASIPAGWGNKKKKSGGRNGTISIKPPPIGMSMGRDS